MSVENRIGTHEFIELEGNPETVKRQVMALVRAGVDGTTLVDEGRRGPPFTLRSKVDMPDLLEARAAYASYCELIGDDPVELVWQDLDLASESLLVAVLNVTQEVCVPLAFASSGGLNPPSLGWLECTWTLIAIETT